MSLNYDYIFGQIDKAKKKRKRWTQADTDKWTKQQKEEKPGVKRARGYGHVSEATNRRSRADMKAEKEAKEKKIRDEEEKERKRTYTGKPGDFPEASHDTSSSRPSGRVIDIDVPKHIKGFGGKKQYHKEKPKKKVVTNLKPKDTKWKQPPGRKQKLRQESGGYAVKDPKVGQDKINEADRKFEKERDTMSITSFAAFLADRKKNPAPSGGFVSAEEADKESETVDYNKWVADRTAKREKREADAKDRKARGGPKVKPKVKPKKEVPKEPPKVEEYQSEDDNVKEDKQEPDKDDGDEGPVTAREYKETGKALWKSWLKNKVGMKRMTEPEDTIQEQEKGERTRKKDYR